MIAAVAFVALIGLLVLFQLALDRADLIDVFPAGFSQVGMWVVFGFLALGVLMNAISRSKPERFAVTPVALALAVLALLMALSAAAGQEFSGMVLDDGAGPVFCTTIMESYPPQCGADSPTVAGWEWDAVEHEQSQTTRWGEYRFEGVKQGHTITVEGPASPLR